MSTCPPLALTGWPRMLGHMAPRCLQVRSCDVVCTAGGCSTEDAWILHAHAASVAVWKLVSCCLLMSSSILCFHPFTFLYFVPCRWCCFHWACPDPWMQGGFGHPAWSELRLGGYGYARKGTVGKPWRRRGECPHPSALRFGGRSCLCGDKATPLRMRCHPQQFETQQVNCDEVACVPLHSMLERI